MTRSNAKSTAMIMNHVTRFSLLMMAVQIHLLPGKIVAKMVVTVCSVTVHVVDKEATNIACEKGAAVEVGVGVPGEQSLCAKVCEAGKCCWEEKGCQLDDPELHCTNFLACSKVFGTLMTSNDSAGDPNPVVDTEALKAAGGAGDSNNDGGDNDGLNDDQNNYDANLQDFTDNTNNTSGSEDDLLSLNKKMIDAACAGMSESEMCRELCDKARCHFQTEAVSYTHLTLPTTILV